MPTDSDGRMTDAMSAKLMADFRAEQVCFLPRTWCRDCADAVKSRSGKCCGNHRVINGCPRCHAKITDAHVDLEYVGHADVRARLCEADPLWTWEPFFEMPGGHLACMGDSPVGMWIRLTIGGVTKPGYGSCDRGKPEAIKELIGDALRNAALSFGVGWKLWAKGDRKGEQAEVQEGIPADDAQTPAKRQRGKPPERAPGNLPRNADGSLSRSQITDDELNAAGVMTSDGQKEHSALRNGAVAGKPDRPAERLTAPDPDDPWANAPPPGATIRTPATAQGIVGIIVKQFERLGITDRDERLTYTSRLAGRELTSSKDMTKDEAAQVADALSRCRDIGQLQAAHA